MQERAEMLHAHVREAFERAQVPWLEALVNQPSYTSAPEDVAAAIAMLDETARGLGLRVESIASGDARFADHRVYTTPGTAADARAGLLVGHADTVFPRSSGFLRYTREGDVARGPGVLDMKSGLSSVFFALEALRAVEPQAYAKLALRIAVVADEEVGSPSSRALYAQLAARTRWAMVFEAGRVGDRVVTARKGTGTFVVSVQGRAAHAGNNHDDGVNAIHALALLIPRIEALTDHARGLTVNVGLIAGGTSKNTVPAAARCEVDVRLERLEDAAALEQAMRGLVADPFPPELPADHRLRTTRFVLEGDVRREPMQATKASQELRLCYERHAAHAGLQVGEAPLQGGGSDANLLAARGVPCIDGLGPFGAAFHSQDEWCSLESLRRRTGALATFLAEEIASNVQLTGR